MWIPTPVYERLPQFLVLAGLVCMSSALYLGLNHDLTLFYFGTGIACTAWGVGIFILRRLYRKGSRKSQDASEPVDASEETSSP